MLKLILSSDYSKNRVLDGTLDSMASSERLKNGLKSFGLFFGLALLAVFIPVFHFILVPGLIITSIFAFQKQYKNKLKLTTHTEYACLSCGKPLNFKKPLGKEARIKCENCFSQYVIKDE